MFVVDDLVGWLVGRLADAGYQRLSTLLRGSEQARALKAAVTAAVQATVGEIGPADGEEAERAAEQINKAFRRREPVPLPPGQPTLLAALQAGIAGQLSACDDAGQLAAGLPGVPVSDVAAKLTGHLIRQIQIRGSQPGPLTPLADQLNHDVTHLEGQRLEGMLAQVLDLLGPGLALPGGAAGPAGQLLAEVRDPFGLEVHRPVEPDVPQPGWPVLPVYVPREHDAVLAEVVSAAAAGMGGVAVLVGGSSTGKTRACWQALELLRDLEPEWRLWHPIGPQAALDELPSVERRTVVWLNEAQRYLETSGELGEQVAAGLRKLLANQARGPVLVLATLWPEFWDPLTARPPGGADPHAQARELFAGHDIPVPDKFTGEQLRDLEGARDPRLVQAAAGSRDRQVIQYLAGAPELLDRYDNAPPAARALIDAAMDAARLGMRPALPRDFLETAAPGYLTDSDWNLQPRDWLKNGLDYTAKPAKGVLGPLTPIRPRPVPGALTTPGDGLAWQLADYLDQHGRRARREVIPPPYFWAAAGRYADPADLGELGRAAEDRGLLHTAGRLHKQASTHGHPGAGAHLVRLLHTLHPGDQRPAGWAAAHAVLDDVPGVAELLGTLREVGATDQITTLANRAAAHTSLDNPAAVAQLLDALREAGASGEITALLDRDPAAHARLDDPAAVAQLLDALREAGASGEITALLGRDPAAHARLDDPRGVAHLLDALREAGASGEITALLGRDPAAHARLDDPWAVASLLDALDRLGASGQITTLADRAAAHLSPLDHPVNRMRLGHLLQTLRRVGATGQAATLAGRTTAEASLDDPEAVAWLLGTLREVGATGQVTALLDRDPAAHVDLDDPWAVASLLDSLQEVGATGQVITLTNRAANEASVNDPFVIVLLHALRRLGATGQAAALTKRAAEASLDDPLGMAHLLDELRKTEATGQITTLLDRNPAAHTSLDNPEAVTRLLDALDRVGATGQITTLLDRNPAAHTSLDNPEAVAHLLDALSYQGTRAQAAELIERLPSAGMFQLFLEQGRWEKFRFGREADGRPAKRWAWTDLG